MTHMAMSKYNRENPFMYLLETKMDELQSKSEKSIREMIIMGSFGLLTYATLIATQIAYRDFDIITIIILPLLFIFSILQVRSSIISINSEEMNERIFGDTYQNINLNNEELLAKINHYNVVIGRVEYVIEYIYALDIIYSVTFIINLTKIMIRIFS